MQLYFYMGFPGGSDGKECACNSGDQIWSLGQEDTLEKGMATHSTSQYIKCIYCIVYVYSIIFSCILLYLYIYLYILFYILIYILWGFSHSSVGKESGCNAGNPSSIPESGRSPGGGKGYPLQYSGLENSMDCIDHGVAKSQSRLSHFHFIFSVSSFSDSFPL